MSPSLPPSLLASDMGGPPTPFVHLLSPRRPPGAVVQRWSRGAASEKVGQRTNGRKAIEVGQGNGLRDELAEPAVHPHDEERMPANIEEVVQGADPIPAEHLLPKAGDRFLDVALRRH